MDKSPEEFMDTWGISQHNKSNIQEAHSQHYSKQNQFKVFPLKLGTR